ncbi:MAG: GTP-binding protein [Candidatus Chisholmbacteria bacterium]|nr:GTP-binding protein [Candidatus Chisholmbacteria bacterium]
MAGKSGKIQSAVKVSRGPVVTIMGHVDHGKSTLIENLREINITGKEQGGITQHIGAYQLVHQGRRLTMIDTPGHAAFAKMRSRGVGVTDVVVLVVAADDGVKPQTKESIKLIQAVKVPFLVAINKIDLPEANVKRVKSQLAEAGVYVEGFGGEVVAVEISAKLKQNLRQLLEMIFLVADLQELKADPQGSLEGVVIESKLDHKTGPVATVVVKNGSLKVGQTVWADQQQGKVKFMVDDGGKRVTVAGPSQPVVVWAFKAVPEVGAVVRETAGEMRVVESKPATSETALPQPSLRIILKTDVVGSLEAIKANLPPLVEVVESNSGEVTEADVLLASTTKALILAFNTIVVRGAQKLADLEGVMIKTYKVIYELLEDVEKQLQEGVEPTEETSVGEASVVAEFNIKGQHIAGCKVETGTMSQGSLVRVKRAEVVVGEAKITGLRQGKNVASEVKAPEECGVLLTPQLDFKIGDVLVSYRKLSAN